MKDIIENHGGEPRMWRPFNQHELAKQLDDLKSGTILLLPNAG